MAKCSCVAPYRKNGNNTYGLNCGAGVTVVSYPRATLRQQQLGRPNGFPPNPLPGDGSDGFRDPSTGGRMTLPTLSVAHEVRAIAQDQAERAAEFREIGEWDWWETNRGNRLHAADVTYDPVRDVGGDGITACGRKTELWIPGVFTRMSVPRCSRCCTRLGYPQGIGSPKNDWRCRLLVEARLAAKGQS